MKVQQGRRAEIEPVVLRPLVSSINLSSLLVRACVSLYVPLCVCVCVYAYVYVCAAVPNRTPRGLVWRLRLTRPSALQRELLLALKNVMHGGHTVRVDSKLLPCWIKDKEKSGWMYLLLGDMFCFRLIIFTSKVSAFKMCQ